MDEALQRETSNLVESWMQHDAGMLGEYLVSDVEDPRLNVQSILTRHFLIVSLFGARFERLLEAELRFAAVLNWAHAVQQQCGGPEDRIAIAHGLRAGADDAEGIAIPKYVLTTYRSLPQDLNGLLVPNYLEAWLQDPRPGTDAAEALPEAVLNVFEQIWKAQLAGEAVSGLSVVEPACGSANDYRFFERYGLARLIDYTGFDLCEKNVGNASRLYPNACIRQGNVFEIQAADGAFDYCVVHDLFEHLSLEGMERALAEVCRVTRSALCLGFFNLHEGQEHKVQPLEKYHWNRLSVPLLRKALEERGFTVQITHIDTFLRWRFGCDLTHNKNAYTFFAER